jgi:hypothetical protein
MILVDTSVLIDFFKGKENVAVKKFEMVIERTIPFGINGFIYQEILQGAATRKEFTILKEYLFTQRFYDLRNGNKSHEDAALIYFRCRRAGYTIRSIIDTLIVQTALENDLMLLHNDSDFTSIARIITKLKIY